MSVKEKRAEAFRAVARDRLTEYDRDTVVEDVAEVQPAASGGAFVAAWVYVAEGDLPKDV